MKNTKTALLSLVYSFNTDELFEILSDLNIQVANRLPMNTKETIISELENLRPSYHFISSVLPGVVQMSEVIKRAKQVSPRTKIILVLSERDQTRIQTYLLANVDAVVYEENVYDSLGFLVRQLEKEKLFICGKTVERIKRWVKERKEEAKASAQLLGNLTDREIEVLHSLTQGMGYKEIANLLNISEATVKTHTNNLFTKLNVKGRTQAVLYALRHGIESLVKKPHILKNLVGEATKK